MADRVVKKGKRVRMLRSYEHNAALKLMILS